MATYTVEVASIGSRMINGKFGPATAWDLTTSTGKKVSYGFKAPANMGITVGTKITFEGTEDKYGIKIVKDTVRLASPGEELSEGTPAVAAATPSGRSSSGGGRGTFPISKDDGQIAIIRQNSLTNAVNLLGHYMNGTDPADRLTADELADWAINLAYKFTEFSSGGRETAAVERIRNGVAAGSDDISKALAAAATGTK